MVNVATVLGGAICALVIAQLMVQCLRALQDVFYQRSFQRLRLEGIAEQVRQLARQQAIAARHEEHWSGWRKFEVQRKVLEAVDCCSLYLVPHDGRPLPAFKPGQFLTFSVKVPNAARPLVRCYSLSDAPSTEYYRCTIKKVPPPAAPPGLPGGRVSSHLLDSLREGDILDIRAPSGAFYLDLDRPGPVVLIAGGIGVTPLVSMLKTVVTVEPRRDVYLFYGVRNSQTHAFREELRQIALSFDQVHLHTCYSRPATADQLGTDYQHVGRVTPALLRDVLPSNNFDFFVCGPPDFMRSILDGLRDWNVPDAHIFTETFGPACVSPRRTVPTSSAACRVSFDRSGTTGHWQSEFATLLDLADACDVPIDSGCRTGNCGTCLTAIKSGSVEYLQAPAVMPDSGTCLPCICAPASDLVLDA